jgi:N-acetylmuramoyl-L-alanine amidase
MTFARRILLWVTLVAALNGVAATSARRGGRTARLALNGRPHLDLATWGAANGLAAQWNARSGELRLTNRWARLLFKADTQRVEFDGVNVWLSYPVLRGGDHLYLTESDADSVLRPLLHPPRVAAGKRITTIALSAGHGGKDPGNLEGSRQEKQFTLQLALELERQLRRAGFRVVQVRDRDKYVSLEERPAIARARGADLLVVLHYNASPGGDNAQGMETYCLTTAGTSSTNDRGGHSAGGLTGNRFDRENLCLAYQLHRAVLGELDFADRGVRHARFKELTLAQMPAAYLEGGFMSSREDARKIYTESGRAKYAAAIVDGLLAYKRLVERGQPE